MLLMARPVMMSAELDACGNTVGAEVTSAPHLCGHVCVLGGGWAGGRAGGW